MATKKTTKPKPQEQKPFEEVLAELEDVVDKLEEGDVPLEESLSAFELGVSLAKSLQGRLDTVQEKIEELTRGERGEPVSKPLRRD